MKLTQKLIASLNSVFNRSADETVAFRLSYDGQMNWQVLDDTLITHVSGGEGESLNLNLNDYTIESLSLFISELPGYSVIHTPSDLSALSATILLDAEGVQGAINGDRVYAHRSLLWVWFDALASELTLALNAIKALSRELVIGRASHDWLIEWGNQYDVSPIVGESDQTYAIRIVNDVLELRSNNRALEKAIEAQTGIQVSVLDIDWWYEPQLIDDLGFIPGDLAPGNPPQGGFPYWGNPENNHPVVCTFAVILGIVDVSQIDSVTIVTIQSIVDRYKAAGTYARYFAPSGVFLNTNTAGENVNDLIYLALRRLV